MYIQSLASDRWCCLPVHLCLEWSHLLSRCCCLQVWSQGCHSRIGKGAMSTWQHCTLHPLCGNLLDQHHLAGTLDKGIYIIMLYSVVQVTYMYISPDICNIMLTLTPFVFFCKLENKNEWKMGEDKSHLHLAWWSQNGDHSCFSHSFYPYRYKLHSVHCNFDTRSNVTSGRLYTTLRLHNVP